MLPNDIFFIEPLQNGSHVMYHVYNDTGNVQHLMCLKSNSVHNDSYLQKNTGTIIVFDKSFAIHFKFVVCSTL